MRIQITDAGRAQSRRPKQNNDCTVRALATASGILYDEAYDILQKLGRQSSQPFAMRRIVVFDWVKVVSAPEGFRWTLAGFARDNPIGNYIVIISGHAIACVNGVYYDEGESSPSRVVYDSWKIEPETGMFDGL